MRTVVNVQILRAMAALVVLWAHLRELFPATPFLKTLPSGLAGVDLFFVISGFIMVVSTSGKPTSAGDFLAKRFSRVAPLYYLMTLLIFAIVLVAPSLMKSSSSDPIALLRSILFIPFYKSPDRIYPTYYLGWTLNYEFLFYAIFSAAIVVRRTGPVWLASAIVIALVAIGGMVNGDDLRASAIAYAWTRPIMLDFVFGMLIGAAVPWISRTKLDPRLLYALLLIGIAGIVFAGRLLPVPSGLTPIAPATDTVLRYGIPAAVIVFSAVALELAGRAWNSRILQMLGDASYSLYLTHFLIVAAVISACNRLGLGVPARVAVALVTVPVCLIVAHLCFRLVETPLNRWVRRRMFG